MTRRKLSEYRAKKLVHTTLNLPYIGWSIDYDKSLSEQIEETKGFPSYVIKVDQGIKGRFKKGLVKLDIPYWDIEAQLSNLHSYGYRFFIVEPYVSHVQEDERYIALTYDKAGIYLKYNQNGGVDVENKKLHTRSYIIGDTTDWNEISKETNLSVEQLEALHHTFNDNYMTMLEINPYMSDTEKTIVFDIAIEVDDAGSHFTDSWSESDFRHMSPKKISDEENAVRQLDENSPASMKLEVINKDGSLFLLLSGGGASVMVADEIYNLGYGNELANYGEYSGNPNTEETYLYTCAVLSLLLASTSSRKVLFIGGAVANFTDVSTTFTGIIKAIEKSADALSDQHIKVYVRRGGPRQEIGLAMIERVLRHHNLLGAVYGPSKSLVSVVNEIVEEVKNV